MVSKGSDIMQSWSSQSLATWVCLATITFGLCGCGGGSPAAATNGEGPGVAPKAVANGGKQPAAAAAQKHVTVDADGRKWIDDIPYDVFLDDPLAEANNTAAVAMNTPKPVEGNPGTPATAVEPGEKPATPAAGGNPWKELISMEQLLTETKRIRNHLTSSLQSQGTYNGNYKELQVDGAVLAALANVIAQHPDDVSWKANTRFIREYGLQLSESSKGLGKDAYEKSQTASEKVISILDGNGGEGDFPADRPLGEVANRAGVMKRIEKASEWMRANINNETKFKGELEQILNEATIISVLGTVAAHPSYESATEEDYKKYAKDLIDGAREAVGSTQDQSYKKFEGAINKITKACTDCHANYGNG
jgi:hypothetical protein